MLFPLYDDVPARRTPAVMIAIIVMNTVVFLWWRQLPAVQEQVVTYRWGFVPARTRQLVEPKPIIVTLEPEDEPTWPWAPPPQRIQLPPKASQILASLLTCMFLHGSWVHLLGNMWFLWIFGNNVEDRLGHVAFLVFYLLGGVLASVTHWLTFPTSTAPVIGASGAVATILGAYAITWPWARVRCLLFLFIFVTVIQLPAMLVLGGWFLLQIGSAVAGPQGVGQNVAWWAHVGGFVAGLVLMRPLGVLVGADGEEPAAEPAYRPIDEFGW